MTSSLARRHTTSERVLTLLAEQGGAEGLTRAEIGRALSVPHGTVDRAVIALLERGAAHKANDGLPGRYLPTGGAFTPRGHLASAPLPNRCGRAGHRAAPDLPAHPQPGPRVHRPAPPGAAQPRRLGRPVAA